MKGIAKATSGMKGFREYVDWCIDGIVEKIIYLDRIERGQTLDGNALQNIFKGEPMRVKDNHPSSINHTGPEKVGQGKLSKKLVAIKDNPPAKKENQPCPVTGKKCSGLLLQNNKLYCTFSSDLYQILKHWDRCPVPDKQRDPDDPIGKAYQEFQGGLAEGMTDKDAYLVFRKVVNKHFDLKPPPDEDLPL